MLKDLKPKIREIVRTKLKLEGPLKMTKLGTGENNINFLVEVANKKLVFRIGMKEWIQKNMRREFNTIKILPEGVGPEAIYYDDSKKIIPYIYSVLSYVEGNHLKKWSKKHLSMHARNLAKLHKIKSSNYGNIYSRKKKLNIVNKVKKDFGDFKETLVDDELSKEIYPKFLKYVKERNNLFLSMKKFSFIHNDPCLTNIVFDGKEIKYIDWEWSKFSDPALDVVMLFDKKNVLPPWKIKLNGERLDFYLDEYFKYAPKDKNFLERMEVWYNYQLLFEYIYMKWKIKHFVKEKVGLSKKEYIRLTSVMGEELRQIWL